MAEDLTFGIFDYVIFAAVLCVSAGIGLFYGCTGGKQATTKEFLMADRSMGWFPVSMSLLASFMSAITLLGTPAEVYTYGTLYIWIGISYCWVIPIAGYLFMPIFYRCNLTSAYEYLERRFNKWIRLAGSLTFCFQMTLYMAIVLYAPALALNQVTGLNLWAAVISIGVVCTFYTTIGGMKAVMWTDVFQIVMMYAGLLAALIQGIVSQGGFAKIIDDAYKGGRIEYDNFDPDPTVRHTFWSLAFGGVFTWLSIYGVNQSQVQRYLTVPSLKIAQIALWINLPGLISLMLLCSFVGLIIFSKYKDCDPVTTKRVLANDQLFPLFVMETLKKFTGVPGLFLACIFSGALSTISSGLNSLAAVVLEDVVLKFWVKDASDKKATNISKILALSFGVACIALTFVAAQLGGVLQAALGLFGIIGGPLLGLFILAMFFPWANSIGAFSGLMTGLIVTLWIGVGAQIYKPFVYKPPVSIAGCANGTLPANFTMIKNVLTAPYANDGLIRFYSLSYMWVGCFGVIVVCIVGLLVSFATGYSKPGTVDPALICPVFEKICPCLPKRFQNFFFCGVQHDEFKEQERLEKERKKLEKEQVIDFDMTKSVETIDTRFFDSRSVVYETAM